MVYHAESTVEQKISSVDELVSYYFIVASEAETMLQDIDQWSLNRHI